MSILTNSLNPLQRNIHDSVFRSLRGDCVYKLYFIDGPGGSGKTYLYNSILRNCKFQGIKTLSLAWTGIAASLLIDGRTSHSAFNLPLEYDETLSVRVPRKSDMWSKIRQASLVIWDVITFVPKYVLDAVDILLRDMMSTDIPFGGKTVII